MGRSDKAVIMAVAGATNTKMDYSVFGKGDGRMCTLFEEIAKESKDKGREEGRAEEIVKMGIKFQFPEKGILDTLREELDISL